QPRRGGDVLEEGRAGWLVLRPALGDGFVLLRSARRQGQKQPSQHRPGNPAQQQGDHQSLPSGLPASGRTAFRQVVTETPRLTMRTERSPSRTRMPAVNEDWSRQGLQLVGGGLICGSAALFPVLL